MGIGGGRMTRLRPQEEIFGVTGRGVQETEGGEKKRETS